MSEVAVGSGAGAYTSELAASLAEDVLQRLCRYVRVGTQSRRERERSPSTPGQLELGRMLVSELHGIGPCRCVLSIELELVLLLSPPFLSFLGSIR